MAQEAKKRKEGTLEGKWDLTGLGLSNSGPSPRVSQGSCPGRFVMMLPPIDTCASPVSLTQALCDAVMTPVSHVCNTGTWASRVPFTRVLCDSAATDTASPLPPPV